ncbi:NodT family efflux transporter outer membrane factor (OMF) lipoprotein [Neisseria perflava]|uniref:efflux transporter outer membrane subunit n=1 Tax=Neisseria perflava TaxID=33053 RepID=UPI00209F5806|nr:efflux transporter outer membrane subunit [Neisseria perflava]MCP1772158.1 NodT family efflux transporter outer membrane factor (OMF) lipoprotein [Neisseria perflava]
MKPISRLLPLAAALALSACTVGPNFQQPKVESADTWQGQHNGTALQLPKISDAVLLADWWTALNDPVLNQLESHALANGLDVQTAALHFAQARMQRVGTAAQYGPDVNLSGSATRNRLSEDGSSTRMINLLGGSNGSRYIGALASPYNLYQVGFDASWEPDLWGRISRGVESADAAVQEQGALLDWARLTLAAEVAQNYAELRTTQTQIRLMKEDIRALTEKTNLLASRVAKGMNNHIDMQRQRTELAALQAQLPALQAQESAYIGKLTLLLGERPGVLNDLLDDSRTMPAAKLPDLAIGLPSEVARRRPDILAAEAKLHSATADIGVAKAALYPSIRIGAKFGTEALSGSSFGEWGSRTWSIGPTLDLPIFDHGRRVSTVKLRELQQQEAAVAYQKTVLSAWKEIDEALTAYAAEQQQYQALQKRAATAGEAYRLTEARYKRGMEDFSSVLDSQRSYLQARRDLADSLGRLNTRYVAINKAVGNVPDTAQ